MKISYGLLAAMISRQYRVDVICRGDSARTELKKDGSYTIVLPNITEDSLMPVMLGYTWHEIAHVKLSDFSVLENIKPIIRTLANIFEDVRIERTICQEYPGMLNDLRNTCAYVFTDYAKAQDLLSEVIQYCLYKARGLTNLYTQSRANLPPKLVLSIDQLLTKVNSCQSTQDCVDLAKQVADLLPDRPQDQQQDQQGDGESDGNQDQDDDLPITDLAKLIKEKVGTIDMDNYSMQNSQIRDTNLADGEVQPMSPKGVQEATAAASALARLFLNIVQSYKLSIASAQQTGRVDTRKLYRLALNSNRVFARRVIEKGINAYVTILLDGSGSMSGRDADLESYAGYAIVQALRTIKGVKCDEFVFFNYNVLPMVYRDKLLKNSNAHIKYATGCTPLGAALAEILAKTPPPDQYGKRIIITISDGVLDDPELFDASVATAERYGIVIYGIGISTNMPDILGSRRCVISSLRQLPTELFAIMKKEITQHE